MKALFSAPPPPPTHPICESGSEYATEVFGHDIVDLPIRLKGNSKRIFNNSSSLLGAQERISALPHRRYYWG